MGELIVGREGVGGGDDLGNEKTRKTTQATKYSLHQLRERRHIGPKCRESPPSNIGKGIGQVPHLGLARAICTHCI